MKPRIAIVGMGCVFPGANNPSEFWQNIVDRVDMVREVPRERRDRYQRFVSCLIYIPRERYNTAVRERLQTLLMEAFDGGDRVKCMEE